MKSYIHGKIFHVYELKDSNIFKMLIIANLIDHNAKPNSYFTYFICLHSRQINSASLKLNLIFCLNDTYPMAAVTVRCKILLIINLINKDSFLKGTYCKFSMYYFYVLFKVKRKICHYESKFVPKLWRHV